MLADLQIYFGVALAGLVSFLSPCVLPLVPPYLGYLGGTTIEEFTAEGGVPTHVWRRVVIASVLFVLGFTTVFVGLGAGASLFGQLIQTYKRELEIVAGLVIILFGLHFLGIFRIGLLYKEARYHGAHTRRQLHRRLRHRARIRLRVDAVHRADPWRPCWRSPPTRAAWRPA